MLIPILTTLALAELSARDDARQIRRNLIIDHVMQWYIRAVVVLGVCWLCGVPWLSIGLAGLFSAVFRWRLNRLRGKDWRYVSPSSWYDRLWMRISAGEWQSTRVMDYYFSTYYEGNTYYMRELHRAGAIAYIVEGLVFAGVLYLYACCRGIFP